MSRHPTARAGKKMLGRYRIEQELGRGGMGVVYLATDENTGRLVALKTTTVAGLGSGEKTRNQRRERFIREVRALTQVNHPNVVHVFDAGEVDDADLGWLLFYTMEYVEGTTLAALVQERGALSGGEAAAVVMQVAAGLGEAHRQGIIHRDVKPANIFLSNDGRALVGDFGIAKIEGSTQITRRDQLVGTPNYLAPEQILGEPVGPQTDVFALGALFFVITQNQPLRRQVDAGSLLASANGNEPMQRMLGVTNLPEALKRVVARCLERDPTRRYVDGTAFAEALSEHATRVPSLQGTPERPSFLTEGTADRSGAFSSTSQPGSLPEAEAADVHSLPDAPLPGSMSSGFGDVEAMAQAMLGEVERRATGTFKQPQRKAEPDALPVARTESTVMFNLRALEDERSARAPGSTVAPAPHGAAPLPVARTESTVVFRLQQEQQAAHPRIALEPVDTDEAGVLPSPSSPSPAPFPSSPSPPSPPSPSPPSAAAQRAAALDEPTQLNDDLPPVSGDGAAVPTTPTATAAPRAPRAPPPRHVLVAAALGAGLLAGAVVAVAGRPAPVTAAAQEPGFEIAPLVPRPALCAPRAVSPDEQSQASAALDEARTLKRDGASPSKVLDKLRFGIERDPNNHLLFYELGRLTTGKEQDDADECVCQIAAESKECGIVQKARR